MATFVTEDVGEPEERAPERPPVELPLHVVPETHDVAEIAEDVGEPEERVLEVEDPERPEEPAPRVPVLAEGKPLELTPKVFFERARATPVELPLHKVSETPTLRDKSCKIWKIPCSTLLEKPEETKFWKRASGRDSSRGL